MNKRETIIRILAGALMAAVFLSWPLWDANSRVSFPIVPLWGEIARPNHLWPRIDTFILLGLCAGLLWKPNHKILLTALFLWLTRLCVSDLNRLQPWVWLYGLILLLRLTVYPEYFGIWLRWLLAAVYFWSGFNKITPYFAEDNFSWLCESFSATRSWGHYPGLGYSLALFEMTLGIILLIPALHRTALWLIALLHLGILLMLSPLGQNWNYVVIPWNLAMIGFVWLSSRTSFSFFRNMEYSSPATIAGAGCLILAGVCPALNLVGWWPAPLSWNMYSNTQSELTFSTDKGVFMPTKEWETLWKQNAFQNGTKMQADDWAVQELKVPLFSHPPVLRRLGEYYCKANGQSYFLLEVNRWDKKKERFTEVPCEKY